MNEPTRPQSPQTQQPPESSDSRASALPQRPMPGPAVRLLLFVLTLIGAVLTGLCPDLLSASVFAAITAGLFAFSYLLTFSLRVFAIPVIAMIFTALAYGTVSHTMQVLLFLPLAIAICLSMLQAKKKTAAVIRGAVVLGVSLLVLFLIGYMAAHGTIAPDALKQSYITFFDDLHTNMTDSMLAAVEAMEQAAQQNAASAQDPLSHPIIDPPVTEAVTEAVTGAVTGTPADSDAAKQTAALTAYVRTLVDLSVNSVKLAMPALIAILCQILSYAAIGIYQLLTRLCRTTFMLPKVYRITVSRTAAVVFVIAYLINMFPIGGSVSLVQIAAANLATMMMPGVFLMGLRSLARRARDPYRRRSFILTAVVLGFLVLVYPSYAIFFVLIDGIGEIFFGGRSIF